MKIDQLNIYPIKGLGGISVNKAYAYERGFENDRRFMLVNKEGKFISQREYKEMALFSCEIDRDELKVHFQDQMISLNITQEEGDKINTTVWGNQINAIEVNPQAHEWFSDMLKQDCKLVKMNKSSRRNKSLLKSPSNTQVSFADGYPYLILGTASLTHLNTKLESPVPIDRFRANIIVDTSYEHQEDDMDLFTLSGLKFRMIKPCARCQVITIDQATGVSTKEPLKTLSGYRKKENKVYFGANVVCMQEGMVRVGDSLIEE